MSGKTTARELLASALGVSLPHGLGDFAVSGITEDSRQVRPGWIFAAVSGTRFDGSRFAAKAVENGAGLVISHCAIDGLPVIVRDDVRRDLAKLAWRWFGIDKLQSDGALVLYGVTGTNGKTTYTYLFQDILNRLGRRCARFGTIEYDLITERHPASHTTPDTMQLAELIRRAYDNGAESIVMEVSSHALDQGRVHGLQFSGAAFTNLSGDHLDYHGSMEQYLSCKLLLFRSLAKGGFSVVNADDSAGRRVVEASCGKVLTYGIENPDADLKATDLKMAASGTKGVFDFRGDRSAFSSPLIGRHNIYNLLAAVGSGLGAGLELSQMGRLVHELPAIPGRLERVGDRNDFEVFVDYAHTDDGLENVLSALKPLVRNRLIVIFGCGGDRDAGKRPRMAKVAEKYADRAIVTSDNPRSEKPAAIIEQILGGFSESFGSRIVVEEDRREAIELGLKTAEPGDIVIIAGKGHEDYQIIGTSRIHFDDREECRKFFERSRMRA